MLQYLKRAYQDTFRQNSLEASSKPLDFLAKPFVLYKVRITAKKKKNSRRDQSVSRNGHPLTGFNRYLFIPQTHSYHRHYRHGRAQQSDPGL